MVHKSLSSFQCCLQGRPTPVQTAEQEEERLCVICLVNDRDTTVLPCRHMCMCHECAQELRKQTSKCPICREHVESLLYIRMVHFYLSFLYDTTCFYTHFQSCITRWLFDRQEVKA